MELTIHILLLVVLPAFVTVAISVFAIRRAGKMPCNGELQQIRKIDLNIKQLIKK